MTNYIIYDSSYKTSTTTNPLRIRNNEIDGIIKIHNGIRYLVFLILVGLIKFVIELNILLVKKMVLQIVLIIILQESKMIYVILYLWKKY